MAAERNSLSRANVCLMSVFLAFFAAFLVYPVGYVLQQAMRGTHLAITERTFERLEAAGLSDELRRKLDGLKGAEYASPEELREAATAALPEGDRETVVPQVERCAQRRAHFSLRFFGLMARNPVIRKCILNSLLLAAFVTVSAALLSIPLAVVLTRFRFPFRRLLGSLILVPMIMPPFVGAIGMKQLFARFGSINLLLMEMGITHSPIDWLASGFWGVAVLEVLHLYPIMYLNVAAALANVDPSMEEAAHNLGGSGLQLFRRITFPLMLPGFFAGAILVFIWALTDLGTPLVFDFRHVIPVQIYDKIEEVHENPMGHALVVLVLVMTMAAFLLSKRLVGRREYAMMSKGSTASSERPLGWLGSAGAIGFLLLVVAAALLPHASVFMTSIAERWFMTVLPEKITGKYYGLVVTHKMAGSSIRTSLFLSVMTMYVNILLGVAIAYLLARKRFVGSNLLDALAMLPLALPGVVLAFGYVACFSGTFLDPRHNPVPLLIISYSVRRLPYMVRAAYAGFQQTDVALEEASLNLGATPLRTVTRITFPLVSANVIAGCILTFAFAMLEVSDSLILASKERFYPMTKAIYEFLQRIDDGAYIASAMGVLGMALLTVSLLVAGRVLGQRMGELFRA